MATRQKNVMMVYVAKDDDPMEVRDKIWRCLKGNAIGKAFASVFYNQTTQPSMDQLRKLARQYGVSLI